RVTLSISKAPYLYRLEPPRARNPIRRSEFFFFFQAEDGIRDLIVTGVQTCALPISRGGVPAFALRDGRQANPAPPHARGIVDQRSEERRVGKAWRVISAPGAYAVGILVTGHTGTNTVTGLTRTDFSVTESSSPEN